MGLGFGWSAGELLERGFHMVASVDIDVAVLKRFKGEQRLDLVAAAAESLPFRDEAFDVVASALALHHFDDVEKALSEIARTARRAAYVVDYDGSGPSPHPRRFLAEAAREAVEAGAKLGFRARRRDGYYELYLQKRDF